MDTNTIAMIILFATFMIFMVLRVPVTFSMLGACVMTALYLGPKYVSSVFLRLGDGVQSFSFLAIPFFIFAGDIMAEGGISDRLVEVANVMVGRCLCKRNRFNLFWWYFRFTYSGRIFLRTDRDRYDDKKWL